MPVHASPRSANPRNLGEVCSFDVGETGSFQNGPIVYDGLLYTTTRQFIAVAAANNNSTYGTKGKNTIVVLGIPK